MPLSLPTTSPIAIAVTRILTAYLSNHRLTPAEAASLGGAIAGAFAGIAAGAAAPSGSAVALAAEPVQRRRAKPRVPRISQPVAPEEPAAPESWEPEPEPEPEPESEPGPVAEPEPAAPELTADAVEPEDEPALVLAPQPEPESDADAEESLQKRKRPSRPRSKRGKGTAAMSASDAMLAEASGDDGVEDAVIPALPESESAPEPVAAEAATEVAIVAPKPRRTTARTRRVTTA